MASLHQPPPLIGAVFERAPTSTPSTFTPASPFSQGPSKTGFPRVQHQSQKKSAFARAREAQAAGNAGSDRRERDYVPVVVPAKRPVDIPTEGQAAPRPQPPSSNEPVKEEPDDWRAQISRENELRVSAMTDEEREEERREILERFGSGIGDILKKAREARTTTAPLPSAPPAKRRVDVSSEGQAALRDEAVKKEPDDWRAQISRENELRVSNMTDEEREEERREVLERFGPGIGDILKKVREARTTTAPLASALSTPTSTRPASRASKQLRFAEVTPNDVHVYESAPSSPRKKALALLPPSADENDVVSLGQFGGTVPEPMDQDAPLAEPEPEEGTPEYIRRRFFPSAPAHNPDLAWMSEALPSNPDVIPSAPPPDLLRFDLAGNPLAAPLHSSLPTHLGLHHHAPDADGVQRAGYTLQDVFTTAHSSVRAQRVAGMRMVAGVARWVGAVARGDADLVPGAMKATEIGEVKARVLASGIGALPERGALGVHAVEVVWECVVGWAEAEEALDVDVEPDMEGIELGSKEDASFPLKELLPQIVAALSTQSESPDFSASARILAILHRLARQKNEIATEIVSTPNLITSLFRAFLLADPTTANPAALDLLTTLASSMRANAQALTPPADALLRFVATLPPPSNSAAVLLTKTLTFYATLAAYGLYAHVASTAHMQLAALAEYLLASDDENIEKHPMRVAWLRLLEVWMVCATDPHATTPEHEILWSQVVAWGWNQDVLALRTRLGVAGEDWETWAALWRAQSAWLEGARVNGVRGGEAERVACVEGVKYGFEEEEGKEHGVVKGALNAFAAALSDFGTGGAKKLRVLGHAAEVLMAAMRLWLACLPPAADGPLSAPPFTLPFARLSELCARLVSHPLWAHLSKSGPGYVLYRPLAQMLAVYLRLSQRLPDVSDDVWMAQALSVLARLIPGDEDCAVQVVGEVLGLVTPEWAAARRLGVGVPQEVWEQGGVGIVKPFLVHAVQPKEGVHVGPWCATPGSIKRTTTLRLPPAPSSRDGLPLRRDWTLSPLDHLLRSGTSPVFNNLPAGWDASEVDVTRAALLFTKAAREVSARHSFVEFVLSREEAVFGCMKVFMLEHGQPHSGDSSEEVFRDACVGRLVDDLLAPYTVAASSSASEPAVPSSPVIPSPPAEPNIEDVAVGFLGAGTPFYQYYTDFVALYDAISFAHPTFARLLLPPTTMRYAVDYRRHLLNDFAHILKSVRTEPGDVVAGDLGEYLWPVESDAQILGAYLRALVNGGGLYGFLRMVATHHVACSIWPDLRESGGEERAEKLLRVVLDQGGMEVVREVVCYRQPREGRVQVPPGCFELSEDVKNARLAYVERVGGEAFVRRVEGLLQ